MNRKKEPPPLHKGNETLVIAYQAGRTGVIDDILHANRGIIAHCIQRLCFPPQDHDDAWQEGRIATVRCVQLYDPLAGVKFSSYLYSAVYHRLRKLRNACGINALIKIPTHQWVAGTARPCSVGSIHRVDGENIQALRTADKGPLVGMVADEEQRQRYLLYRRLMATLDWRQQYVIRRRMAGVVLDRVGKELGVSRERIRQIEAKAIRRMRDVYQDIGKEQ